MSKTHAKMNETIKRATVFRQKKDNDNLMTISEI